MKYNSSSNKIITFLDENPDLIHPKTENCRLRILENEIGALSVFIELGDFANSKELRTAIPYARDWQKRLKKHQGNVGMVGPSNLLKCIEGDLMRNEPDRAVKVNTKDKFYRAIYLGGLFSYQEVADGINHTIEKYLYEHIEQKMPEHKRSKYYATLNKCYLPLFELQWSDPIERSVRLLMIFGMKRKESVDLLDFGIDNIRAGRRAFLNDQPISRNKLISVFRSYNKT